jgi:sarcosine oxidase subunit alpha
MERSEETPPDGSIIVADGEVRGRVCTSRYSPNIRQSIGLALVDPELAVMDGPLEIYSDRRLTKGRISEIKTVNAKIVPLPFYDPKGERIRG